MSDEQAESEWRAYARKRMGQAAKKFLPTPEEHAAYQAEAAELQRRAAMFPELVAALEQATDLIDSFDLTRVQVDQLNGYRRILTKANTIGESK